MLSEQRIAVIGGNREIGFTVRAKDYIRWLGELDNRSRIVPLWISTAYSGY